MAITATFQANFEQFVGAVRTAGQSLDTMRGIAEKLGFAVTASLASTEIRRFAGDVRRTADQFIGAFAEEEVAVKKLQTALEAQGTGAAIAQYQALASQFQRTTVFGDELIIGMQALLVQVGNVMPEQMNAALTAATNLSAGLGVDLRTATMLVGKVFEGETGTLKRYGIVIDEAKLKADPLAATLEAINAKFGGQAVAQLETYSGRTAALGNQISDLKEKGGKLLVDALTPILTAFTNLPEPIQTTIATVGIIAAALAPLALSFAAVVTVIGPLIAAIGGGAGLVAVLGTLAPFLGVAGIIAAGIGAWVYVFKNADVFVWAAVTAWGKLREEFATAARVITKASQDTYNGIKTWLVDRFQAVVDGIKAKVAAISGFFKDMYDKVVGSSYVPDMLDAIQLEFTRLGPWMVEPTRQATTGTAALFGNLLSNLKSILPTGLQGIFDDLMPRVTTFLSGFSGAFGSTFASLFGDGSEGLSGIVRSGLTRLGDLMFPGFGSLLAGLAPIVVDGLQKLGGLFGDFFRWLGDGFRAAGRAIADFVRFGDQSLSSLIGQVSNLSGAIIDFINKNKPGGGTPAGTVPAVPDTSEPGGITSLPGFLPFALQSGSGAPVNTSRLESLVSTLINDMATYQAETPFITARLVRDAVQTVRIG